MEELIWRIFEKSGHVESYLLYKTLRDCRGKENEEVGNEDSACKGSGSTIL